MQIQEANTALLRTLLSVAVPIRAQKLMQLPEAAFQSEMAGLEAVADGIAFHGDLVIFSEAVISRGNLAHGFTEVARAVAAASFMPGGITIFGAHFENARPDTVRCFNA